MMKAWIPLLALTLLATGTPHASAAGDAAAIESAPSVLRLGAEVVRRVGVDEMTVVVASERAGDAPGTLNAQVLAELDTALAQSRRAPGVTARLGGLHTQPAPRGRPGPWQVRGEIVLESRDFQVLGELAGRLAQRLQIVSVRFGLSGERRRAVEEELLGEAAAAFQDKSRAAARALGFSGYRLQEVSLGTSSPRPGPVVMRMDAASESALGIPTEGGETDVQVRIEGSIVLLGGR